MEGDFVTASSGREMDESYIRNQYQHSNEPLIATLNGTGIIVGDTISLTNDTMSTGTLWTETSNSDIGISTGVSTTIFTDRYDKWCHSALIRSRLNGISIKYGSDNESAIVFEFDCCEIEVSSNECSFEQWSIVINLAHNFENAISHNDEREVLEACGLETENAGNAIDIEELINVKY